MDTLELIRLYHKLRKAKRKEDVMIRMCIKYNIDMNVDFVALNMYRGYQKKSKDLKAQINLLLNKID